MTTQDIAASIVEYSLQAALDEDLVAVQSADNLLPARLDAVTAQVMTELGELLFSEAG
ncbi:MAG: hypothetical protein V7739_18880 [Motiliproteus sp.]